MNRLISAIVAVLLGAAGSAVGGYWNPQGVVPVGDARIPAQLVGWLITGLTGISGLFGGAAVPWKTWMAAATDKLKAGFATTTLPGTLSRLQIDAAPYNGSHKSSVSAVPIAVEHLQGCVYHLRVALRDDRPAQDLLDQIAVKVGRVTAEVGQHPVAPIAEVETFATLTKGGVI